MEEESDADCCVMTADCDNQRSALRRIEKKREKELSLSCQRRSCMSAKHHWLYALDRDDDARSKRSMVFFFLV